jgi:hypothetical protein
MSSFIGILLIGYERKNFLVDNIEEVMNICNSDVKIFVSVDGPKANQESTVIRSQDLFDSLNIAIPKRVSFLFRDKNLGCDLHIPESINWVLETCSSVLVIEDDIKISKEAIDVLLQRTTENEREKVSGPVIGMSGIRRIGFSKINFWRLTNYFTAWGFSLNKDFWTIHSDLRRLIRENSIQHENHFRIDEVLKQSVFWNNLSNRKQKLWLERFTRGNYDYQIQLTMWAHNISGSAPACRVVDNVGHGLVAATHTKNRPPWFLHKSALSSFKFLTSNDSSYKIINRVFEFIDSNTWAGDGLLSSRGRNIGLRSLGRIILNKLSRRI